MRRAREAGQRRALGAARARARHSTATGADEGSQVTRERGGVRAHRGGLRRRRVTVERRRGGVVAAAVVAVVDGGGRCTAPARRVLRRHIQTGGEG